VFVTHGQSRHSKSGITNRGDTGWLHKRGLSYNVFLGLGSREACALTCPHVTESVMRHALIDEVGSGTDPLVSLGLRVGLGVWISSSLSSQEQDAVLRLCSNGPVKHLGRTCSRGCEAATSSGEIKHPVVLHQPVVCPHLAASSPDKICPCCVRAVFVLCSCCVHRRALLWRVLCWMCWLARPVSLLQHHTMQSSRQQQMRTAGECFYELQMITTAG
jgi:hypothetical protein